MKILNTRKDQKGFTIVELMIATAVLSVLLLLVTLVMISLGRLYQKGINQAKVQNATRSITDDVSQHLQLMNGSASVAGPESGPINIDGRVVRYKTYCLDDIRYTYVVGIQLGSDSSTTNPQIRHVLWRDTVPNCNGASVPNLNSAEPTAGGVELVPANSRITVFDISNTAPHVVRFGIAYGDDDLLTGTGEATKCNNTKGSEFCATSFLNTLVARRL